MKHILIKDTSLNGWEYGMLRAFENAIIKATGAEIIEIPQISPFIKKRMDHGMRWSYFRGFSKKQKFTIKADVIWCILMGPENYKLDLFKGWNLNAKYRIVYLIDTFDHQVQLCAKLFSKDHFNYRITSFIDALPNLEKATGKKWFCVEQGIPRELFYPVPFENRLIHFTSYGRSLAYFNKAVFSFCKKNNLYFDTMTHNGKYPIAPAETLYEQYAWHTRHSLFSISWPVEITNIKRAGMLSPITCRWFEAGASGTIILGKKPLNSHFDNTLCVNLVNEIDPVVNSKTFSYKLDEIWEKRKELYDHAYQISINNAHRWTWDVRVAQILNLLN